MIDIINLFCDFGYKCDLIAGSVTPRNRRLNDQVKVRRIVKYNNTTALNRVFTWGWGTIEIFFIILFKFRNSHLFFVSNPPMANLVSLILPNKYSLLIFDIYPDAIVELGLLNERSVIISKWMKANRRIFSRANDIFTLTNGMKNKLSSYTDKVKIDVIPLWSDNEYLTRIAPEENSFLKEHNLLRKFVVLYSGNIGVSNNVEVLAEVAKYVNENVVFIIIGKGARRKYFEERIIREKLANVILLPWQDAKDFPNSLSAASLGVVSLGSGVSNLSIPSKLFSLLSVESPILGIASKDSDLCKLIESNKLGECFLPEDTQAIAEYINYLERDKEQWEFLSGNAFKASSLFTRKNALNFIYQEG